MAVSPPQSAFPEVVGNLEQEMVMQRELESAASQMREADEEEIHQLRKKLEEVRRFVQLQYSAKR